MSVVERRRVARLSDRLRKEGWRARKKRGGMKADKRKRREREREYGKQSTDRRKERIDDGKERGGEMQQGQRQMSVRTTQEGREKVKGE